ncbi:MAG: hypothetical protein A3K67_05165 [Euryarchaeota archaeon RBG_16_62_10]|nr:MAG: hypothetical protein A3K67_05165 [Euryarchaeota archaeon RBG_16_62_10]
MGLSKHEVQRPSRKRIGPDRAQSSGFEPAVAEERQPGQQDTERKVRPPRVGEKGGGLMASAIVPPIPLPRPNPRRRWDASSYVRHEYGETEARWLYADAWRSPPHAGYGLRAVRSSWAATLVHAAKVVASLLF